MGLAGRNEVAQTGLVTLVIYPRQAVSAPAPAPFSTKPPRPGIPWLLSLFVFLLFAGITFAGVYTHELLSGTGWSTPSLVRNLYSTQGLGLRAEYEGERLLITWSRTSVAVRSAAQGVLRIDDGGRHRDVPMDALQVAAGSVLYNPASDDVTFRLEVQCDSGKPVVESIRVLDAGKPAAATTPGESQTRKAENL